MHLHIIPYVTTNGQIHAEHVMLADNDDVKQPTEENLGQNDAQTEQHSEAHKA
jgi:hypothetical protein